MDKERMMRAALAGLLSVGAVALGTQAMAADGMGKAEKCFGIARAGMNDCAVKGSSHACAGQAKRDGEKDAYVLVPAGTCRKIVGGTTMAPMAPKG